MNFTKLARTAVISAALTLTPATGFAAEATVLEIVTFEAQKGATAGAINSALAPIATKMGQYGTLVARSVAEGPKGKWTMVNYWTDRDAMNRVNEEALKWPEFGALPAVANLKTLQMQQLDISSSVNLETK